MVFTNIRGRGVGMGARSRIGWEGCYSVSEGPRNEGHVPQSEADLVWEAVEGIQRGVSHEMICLRDWCCAPFALFVSIFISTDCGRAKELRRDPQDHKLP